MNSNFLDQFHRQDDSRTNEAIRRLEAAESAWAVADSLGLDPTGLVAGVARVGLGLNGSLGLPLIQSAPVRAKLAEAVGRASFLSELFPKASRPARLALQAGLLQTLDAWEASHHAAQEADDLGETATAAAWHMIAHRREPDPGNARYWARRVKPDAFAPLAPLAASLLAELDQPRPVDRSWNLATMIDLCDQVLPGSDGERLARRLQRLEMIVLLGQSLALDSAQES